jgi:AsmA protein
MQSRPKETAQGTDETAPVTRSAARRVSIAQISWLIGLVVAIAVAAAVAASVYLTSAVLHNDLAAQIRKTTGFTTEISGNARFVLLPRPHIEIDSVVFSNPKAALRIDVEKLIGYLRVVPLLAGRVEIGHAVLYDPNMIIDVDDRPMTPDSMIGRAVSAKPASPEAAQLDRAPLAVVDFVNGKARLHRHAEKQDIFIDDINVRADWRSLDASATLTGQLAFRNNPVQVKAWFSQPIELLRGGDSAASLQLDSNPVTLAFSGEISAGQHFQYLGSLSFATPALRDFAALIGVPFTKHGKFANFDLRCDANLNANAATFTNLQMDLDGNDYEGTLAVEVDGPAPQISGTLATDLLDVTPFLAGSPAPQEENGEWSQKPLELADLGFANLDLRLSATRLRLGDIEVSDAALSVLTHPGFIDVSLGEATANGGTLRGRLSLSGGKSLDLHATLSATGVDVGPMLHTRLVAHPIAGAMTGSVTLDGSGGNFNALMQGLTGHADVDVANGQLLGFDLENILRSGPPSPREPESSQAAVDFDTAHFSLQIDKGVATVIDGKLLAPSLTGTFGGSADLGNRSVNLWALAKPVATESQTDVRALRLKITGPWDNWQVGLERAEPDAH